MSAGVHHAMLGLACLALFAAGHRLSARLSDRPLDRIVSASVFATAAAVGEALALGLFSLGADSIALCVAACLTYLAALAGLPVPAPSTSGRAIESVRSLSRGGRAAAGALAALALLLLVWSLRYPALGFDGAVYHLPEVANWVANGEPGSTTAVSYLFPFGNYPVTNEVLLAWGAGISRGLVPIFLWSQVVLLLTAAAAVLGLRALGATRLAAGLATAAVLSTPVLVHQLGTPSTDLPALCWLVCCGALVARAEARPRLLFAAVVAAGLAVGTKTSPVPLVLLVLGIAAWRHRRRLRPHAVGLAISLLAALAVGGLWYVRNALDHGSPLWPFQTLPGGDPVPHVWSLIDNSLLERPAETLRPRVSGYLDILAGAVLLVATAPLAWLAARRRLVAVTSGVSVAALLIWAAAPSTGQPDTPVFDVNVVSTTRYGLPAVAAAAIALALAGSARGAAALAARAALAAALVWSLVRDAAVGHVALPGAPALLVAAVAGALVAVASGPRLARQRTRAASDARARAALAVVAAAVIGGVVSVPARHLVQRNADVVPGIPGAPLVRWAVEQPGFDNDRPIYFAGTVYGQLTGNRLRHRLVLVPASAGCSEVRGRATSGLLVVAEPELFRKLGVSTPAACVDGLRPSLALPGVRVYGSLSR